jgi:SRSO17 transposase
VSPRVAGNDCPQARERKDSATTTGPLITLTAQSGHHWLLIRRHLRHGQLAFYRCYSPTLVPLAELIRIAGRRWTIEESFQAGKGLAGLDDHQLRRWLPWRRWTLLAMLAHACSRSSPRPNALSTRRNLD